MKRIIIADDSGAARMFIRRCLEIVGCREAELVEAANGKEVLERLKEGPADLIMTDLNMPEMDGMELLRRLKASPRHFETPVIVVTSAANPEKIKKLEEMKAFKILSKPVSPPIVAEAIAPLLEEEG